MLRGMAEKIGRSSRRMSELLIELLSEEMPAALQERAAFDLGADLSGQFTALKIHHATPRVFASPRRLTVVFTDVDRRQPDTIEERKGPQVEAPQKALDGFVRSNGLNSIDECDIREVKGQRYYFLSRAIHGADTATLVPALLCNTIRSFPWSRSMKWGSGTLRWIRPLRHIMCVFDGMPILAESEIESQAESLEILALFKPHTFGHRLFARDPIIVANFDEYRKSLLSAFVVIDPAERRERIANDLFFLADSEQLTFQPDDQLITEVCGLVEWPRGFLCSIDEAYMSLPSEIMVTTMRKNQKYFALFGRNGRLSRRFVAFANIPAGESADQPIIAGYERVLRARLADAKFFWEQDRVQPLIENFVKLHDITFHAKLGSVAKKSRRLQRLSVLLGTHIPGALPHEVDRAAELSKCDLVSFCVREFPDLQGTIGRYLALESKESDAVANAIAEHYSPLGPSDPTPSAPLSVVLSLADKVDTLVGFFAIGQRPSGTKDPFALRRATIGIVRIILDNKLRIDLRNILRHAHALYVEQELLSMDAVVSTDDLMKFVLDRLRVHLRDLGLRPEVVAAILNLGDDDDIFRIVRRIEALETFLHSRRGTDLLDAFRRSANILRREQKKDQNTYAEKVDSSLLVENEERALFNAVTTADTLFQGYLSKEDYGSALLTLSEIRPEVSAFFDRVTVNATEPELRRNRLNLLSHIRSSLGRVADFVALEDMAQ